MTQRWRYKQKLNEKHKYTTQCRENESRFHYLCGDGRGGWAWWKPIL